MGTLKKIKLFLGLIKYDYSIDRWVLTQDNISPPEISAWTFYGPQRPDKKWPYLWKQSKFIHTEMTLFGWRDYVSREVPMLLEVYSEKD